MIENGNVNYALMVYLAYAISNLPNIQRPFVRKEDQIEQGGQFGPDYPYKIQLKFTIAMAMSRIAFFLLLVGLFASCGRDKPPEVPPRVPVNYSGKAREALLYCRAHKLNTSFFILIDLSVHSGLKRFFIWDFNKACITDSFLVSHGVGTPSGGKYAYSDKPMVSNQINSNCSSVGKYIIGERGPSNWGIRVKYLLHGMDPTNSNACRRNIVFHSWPAVGDDEVYPLGVTRGAGCPAISNKAFTLVDRKLRAQSGGTLMWIII